MVPTSVKQVLEQEGLAYPQLSVLKADESLYTALLVQPRAQISVSRTGIRNLNGDTAERLATGAINLAIAERIELLVSPEYSVPWSVIEALLQTGGGPEEGKIWVLGCESLSIGEAQGLKQRFANQATVIHESIDPTRLEPNTAVYYNPLIYLFRTKANADDSNRLVMLVQFKTHPSGDPANTEVESMVKGTEIYIFEGPRSEIRLITFICSDVLGLPEDTFTQCYEDTLLLHIQLNDNPRAEVYSRYKRHLFGSRCDKTELVCLNWAAGIEYHFENGTQVIKTNIAGSAWHTRSNQVDTADARVERNHRAGLYYTRNESEKCHVLHFSYGPAAFLLRATKVKHIGVPAAQSYRLGPEISQVFHWDEGAFQWQPRTEHLDDGFAAYCDGYNVAGPQLLLAHTTSPLAVERIVELTGGTFSPEEEWYKADKLKTARVGIDEVVQRITVTQDPDGEHARHEGVSQVQALAALIGNIPFKHPLEDIKAEFRFGWGHAHPYCNVTSVGGNPEPATIIYAGVGKRPDQLAGIYAKAGEFARRGKKPDRFSVVYQDGTEVKIFSPRVPNPIDKTVPLGNNITEPEK
ncbi:MAG: hypothetical protein HYS18_06110 [Burkholderiales bacterium]|nr:hypothetical protein [Burkholderiales bacterium]